MDEQQRKFLAEGARAIDSLNRLLFFVALMVFYFLLVPILYKVETATTKTATQLESIEKRLTATEEAVLKNMSGIEKWQKANDALKRH